MSPQIATFVCVLGIVGLFWLDWDRKARTSIALWIPTLWLAIAGSRPVSLWLESGPTIDSPEKILDGSPLDRAVFVVLLILGLIVLIGRTQRVATLLRSNLPIVLFFVYCGASICWSDFAEVALKRWIKSAGDLVMVLVVLTEADYHIAVKRFLARTAFILIPLSILFIKYYPNLGRSYNRWTWTPSFGGVTTSKNMLGMICMLLGLWSLWRFLLTYRTPRSGDRKRRLVAHGALLAMVVWLFSIADSMTSLSCFLLGAVLIVVTNLSVLGRKRLAVHLLVVGMVLVSFSTLFLGIGSDIIGDAMARDATTLTGRTDIWKLTLSMTSNGLVGTGFESFWLGKRLERMWSFNRDINQAHNGYIETYLNLGWIGVVLLSWMLVTGYVKVVGAIRRHPEGTLCLAYFVVAVVYNFTEAAFKMMSPVWICFLLATVGVSKVQGLAADSSHLSRLEHIHLSLPFKTEIDYPPSVG
jgi:exopolysaccharide production protein ExoQ